MDSRSTDRTEDPAVAETPEDVAVLYSWANLHGAKYRDFSASRREYRAQLRQRAAEQVKEQALLAQAEAEDAATSAEMVARHATKAALNHQTDDSDSTRRRAPREPEEAGRTASAERLEAARRAEVAALADATARREEREIAEAHASAQRQAARYADAEIRRKAAAGAPEIPGRISDPYVPHAQPSTASPASEATVRQPAASTQESPMSNDRAEPEPRVSAQNMTPRRPQGYRPDEASGVRQIYRGPDDSQAEYTTFDPLRHLIPTQSRTAPAPPLSQDMKPISEQRGTQPLSPSSEGSTELTGQRRGDPRADVRTTQTEPLPASGTADSESSAST